MAQWAKALAAKAADLSLNPRAHRVEGKDLNSTLPLGMLNTLQFPINKECDKKKNLNPGKVSEETFMKKYNFSKVKIYSKDI